MRKALREEAPRLKLQAQNAWEHSLLAKAKQLLCADEERLSLEQSTELEELCKRSVLIQRLVEMRRELRAIWERTNISREQIVLALQDWCDRAEASGNHWLEELSKRIRRYELFTQ